VEPYVRCFSYFDFYTGMFQSISEHLVVQNGLKDVFSGIKDRLKIVIALSASSLSMSLRSSKKIGWKWN
jgi:hypothetical protein